MAASRLVAFVELIRASQLLEPEQLESIKRGPLARSDDPVPLAQDLVDRGWLTRYQITEMVQGRGKGLVLGPYRLLQPLGEGAMGQVFKAAHRAMNRTVALKIIRKEWLANETAIRRFHREVQAASQLVHPHIVLAYDAGQIGDTHYFAMEYVEGVDLARLVKESGPLHVGEACEYVRQAALGLEHAFEQGLVHRDIKPHNLMVVSGEFPGRSRDHARPGPHVKILDFGVARLQGEESREHALTQTGTVVGTPDFIAPEQALNARAADIRADLYSLGCTLYYLLAGRAPYRGNSLAAVLLKHQLEEAEPIQHIRPDLPAAVASVVAKLMAKKPEDRYQTPRELAVALESYCGGRDRSPVVLRKSKEAAAENDTEWAFAAGLSDRKRNSGARARPEEFQTTEQDLAAGKRSLRPRPQTREPNQLPWILYGSAACLLGGLVLALILFLQNSPSPTQKSESVAQAIPNAPLPLPQHDPRQPLIARPENKPDTKQIRPPGNRAPILPGPAPKPLVIGPGIPDHRAAEWAIRRGATVTIESGAQPTKIKNLELLPHQAFRLVGIAFPIRDNRIVKDEELHILEPLRDLRNLSLWATDISDHGLASIHGLVSLESLDLGATAVSDAGLVHLTSLKQLRTLAFHSTHISGSGFGQLQGLEELEALLMHGSELTDEGLAQFPSFKRLRNLDIGSTAITDDGLKKLKEFKVLRNLSLGARGVRGPGLQYLKDMRNLETLTLDLAPVTDDGLVHLRNLQHLRGLQLAYTRVTDAGLLHLRSLHTLAYLRLTRTRVSDEGLSQFRELTQLSSLQLDETDITDAGLEHLFGLSKLRSLDLRKTQVSDAGIRRLEAALPGCQVQH